MTKKIKSALLASLAALSLTSAHAATYNGDLIVGFTTSSGNDFMYDLGAASALTNGKSWNLTAYLSGIPNLANPGGVKWGVIADKKIGGVGNVWLTSQAAPSPVNGIAAWGNIDTALKTLVQGMASPLGAGTNQTLAYNQADATGVSWYEETIYGYGTYSFVSYADPNSLGLASAPFYLVVATNSAATQIGTFTLSGGGILTYTTSVAPPAPLITSVARAGNISSVSFTTASGSYTYKLCGTNSAGLTSSTNWPQLPGSLTGDGSVKTLTHTNSSGDWFYRVSVQ